MAIWNGDDLGLSPASAAEDVPLAIILDRTNFYAEMGGQVGDAGTLTAPTSLDLGPLSQASPSVFDVESTKAVGGYVLHIGRLRSGMLAVGETIVATVADRRIETERNQYFHTFGQLGFARSAGRWRSAKEDRWLTRENCALISRTASRLATNELARVETLVNQSIAKKLPVYIDTAPQDLALKINGLRAVFGEKYPPVVRVVSVGAPVKDLLADPTNEKLATVFGRVLRRRAPIQLRRRQSVRHHRRGIGQQRHP